MHEESRDPKAGAENELKEDLADGAATPGEDALEDAWQASAPAQAGMPQDEEIDPELLQLASSGRRGSVLRLVLFGVVIWFGISLINDWRPQLEYFFSDSEPIELGSVTEFASHSEQDPNFTPSIPNNRYVSLKGVPTRRSQSKKYQFFKLVGGQVYVETLRDDAHLSELQRQLKSDVADTDRTYFSGAGRAIKLSQQPARYEGLRSYYFENYQTYFCSMELTQRQQHLVDATGEACVEAFLIEDGVKPRDNWWYMVIASIVGLFVLLNVWWAVRWVRDFMRA